VKRTPLVRKTRLSPKASMVRREVPEWKRVSVRMRAEPSGPARDPAYLAWVREHRCEVPGCRARRIEAHHFGKRAKGTKCSDYETVPLCTAHHREFHDRGAIGDTPRSALRVRWERWSESAKVRFDRDAGRRVGTGDVPESGFPNDR